MSALRTMIGAAALIGLFVFAAAERAASAPLNAGAGASAVLDAGTLLVLAQKKPKWCAYHCTKWGWTRKPYKRANRIVYLTVRYCARRVRVCR